MLDQVQGIKVDLVHVSSQVSGSCVAGGTLYHRRSVVVTSSPGGYVSNCEVLTQNQ